MASPDVLTAAELRRIRAWVEKSGPQIPRDLPLAVIVSRDHPGLKEFEKEQGRRVEEGDVINGYRVFFYERRPTMVRYENPAGWGAIGRRLWAILRYKWWDLKEWWQNRNSQPVDKYRDMAFPTPDAKLDYAISVASFDAYGRELEVDHAVQEFKYSALAAEIWARKNNDRWRFEIEREANRIIAARVQLDSRLPPLFIRNGMVRKDDSSE